MIYFVRHACRAENGTLEEIFQMTSSCDPHITKVGKYQSFILGERLAFQIPDIYRKTLLVVSSPYLRCLKTAESLVNGLKEQYIKLSDNRIHVEDALVEHQSKKYFPENHFPSLAYFNTSVIAQQTSYNTLNMFREFRQADITFPETSRSLYDRFIKILHVLEDFARNPDNKEVVLILVGHGFFVNFLYKAMKGMNVCDYPYLSTSKLYFDVETERMEAEFLDEVFH
jgi:broad specificity phosphatase PhoE